MSRGNIKSTNTFTYRAQVFHNSVPVEVKIGGLATVKRKLKNGSYKMCHMTGPKYETGLKHKEVRLIVQLEPKLNPKTDLDQPTTTTNFSHRLLKIKNRFQLSR